MEVNDALSLFGDCSFKNLVFGEKFVGGSQNILLIDAPKSVKTVDNLGLVIKHLYNPLTGHKVETNNAISDPFSSKHLHPTHLTSIITVSSAAGLNIGILNLNNPELVSGHHSPLVEQEAVLPLGISLVDKTLINIL